MVSLNGEGFPWNTIKKKKPSPWETMILMKTIRKLMVNAYHGKRTSIAFTRLNFLQDCLLRRTLLTDYRWLTTNAIVFLCCVRSWTIGSQCLWVMYEGYSHWGSTTGSWLLFCLSCPQWLAVALHKTSSLRWWSSVIRSRSLIRNGNNMITLSSPRSIL